MCDNGDDDECFKMWTSSAQSRKHVQAIAKYYNNL